MADVVTAEGPGAADRGGVERLARGHAVLAHGERDAERDGRSERGARVAVRREGDRHPGVEEAPGGGIWLTRGELDAGQQRGDGLRSGESVDILVREEGDVVDARGAELDRESHPGRFPELPGVQSQPEPAGRSGLEHAAALLHRERTGLAEDVDPSGIRRAGVQHRAGDQVDVGVGVVCELARNHMGTQECCFRGQLAGESQRALLVAHR